MVYIKQITVQGFKSYKEQTVIDSLSPKHNVVVGRNGSGKSNFFAAIRFVLSDAYTNMSREERQALLHEGSGTAVMSAYVEIIFDNRDNRFPTGKEEVILRRTIGLKKDEYSLDKKSASKSDVMNLLESAGFSRSNPYYIVPQGRITTLTNAKDSERLNLLKEVAGTQVYEQRRRESLKIMEETNQKRNKIDDLLKYIEERIAELEDEKEELKGFQEKDKERRCLEYTIYSKEQSDINNALEEIDGARTEGLITNEQLRELFITRETQIAERDAEISSLQHQLSQLSTEKSQLEQDRREQFRIQTSAELMLQHAEEETRSSANRADELTNELDNLNALITSRTTELQRSTGTFEETKAEENRVKLELERTEAQVNHLYEKQGRNARFRNKSERNRYLDTKIADIRSSIEERTTHRSDITLELEEQRTSLEVNTQELQDIRAQLNNRKNLLEQIASEITAAQDVRDTLYDQRKELWREEARTLSTLEQARDELHKAEKIMQNSMDRATSLALIAAKRIASETNLAGYYGPLCELFQVDDRYRTAVEVSAGASLFHVVVEDDETAAQILDVINREKAGRVTFIPLNRVRTRSMRYPEANDAVPMIQKLKFAEQHRKAMEQVFGNCIICPNLETASRYARSEGFNATTLTGDKSDNKGVLSGGYYDNRKSRLQAVKNNSRWRKEFEEAESKLAEIRKRLLTLDQQVTKAISDLQRAEARRKTILESGESLQRALAAKTKSMNSLQDALTRKEQTLKEVDADIALLTSELDTLQQEKSAPYSDQLTAVERQSLQAQSELLVELQKSFSRLNATRIELESQRSMIESELRDNLYMKREQLLNMSSESDVNANANVEAQKQIRNQALSAVSQIARRIEEIESTIEELKSELKNNENERLPLLQQNRSDAAKIDKHQKSLEKNMQKKSLLSQKKDECNKSIRDLGVLPEEAFDKYKTLKIETVVKRLHKVHDALKGYSHVNKKAFDQYANFTKQRDQLLERREELQGSQASISDLIEVLDQRKDEAIERTFKQVSKAFAEIFEKLVPAGRGRLIIQRKVDRDAEEDDDGETLDTPDTRRNAVENYVGVAISVSFNSKDDEQQRIQQLSGGQKSLCALALIFAIQRCDPAPFYLMDEVDAALDAQYRTAVASMLNELSSQGQFICTTFRPEMIQKADKFYGVFFQKKISTVKPIDREDALQFVDSEAPR